MVLLATVVNVLQTHYRFCQRMTFMHWVTQPTRCVDTSQIINNLSKQMQILRHLIVIVWVVLAMKNEVVL